MYNEFGLLNIYIEMNKIQDGKRQAERAGFSAGNSGACNCFRHQKEFVNLVSMKVTETRSPSAQYQK